MIRKLCLAAAAVLCASNASAAVTYTFDSEFGSFVYVTNALVTANRTIAPARLASCTLVYASSCAAVQLDPDPPFNTSVPADTVRIALFPGFYQNTYFADGAIGSPGEHSSLDFAIPATLNVAVTPAPEPASWAMLLGGFGMLGGALRRHRRVALA